MTLTIQVVGSAIGSSPVREIATLNEASAIYRQFIDENGFGASEAGQCFIRQGEKVVAHVSYNGKVWEGKSWTPDAQPIFVP